MNKRYATNNPQQYKLPIILLRAPEAVKKNKTRYAKQARSLCQRSIRCDAICALTTRFKAEVTSRQNACSTWKLKRAKELSEVSDQSTAQSKSKLNLYKKKFRLETSTSSLKSNSSAHLKEFRNHISKQRKILMLLCLLSIHSTVPLMSLLTNGEQLSSAQRDTNLISDAEHLSARTVRGTKISTNELDILVRTKHGFFRGRLISSDNEQSKFNNINSASVIGFLGKLYSKHLQSKISDHLSEVIRLKISYDQTECVGIKYASAPTRRLRFMPPTAHHYASNQVHDMLDFGPICWQRYPLGINLTTQFSREYDTTKVVQQSHASSLSNQNSFRETSSESTGLDLNLRLMEKIVPRETFNYLSPLIRELATREQSEDCLNLNIYVPREGEYS